MSDPGASSLVVDILGLPFRLTTANAPLRRLLAARYRHFLRPLAEPAAELQLEVVSRPYQSDADVRVQARGSGWRITRGDFEAEWDDVARRGWVRQTLNPYSTDSLLRIVHSLLLATGRGFLLHASSVILEGCAYVFTGVSGAGKTTIASLAPADAVLLTDEISCIRAEPEGWTAYGTPFAGELGASGRRVSAPVKTIYVLRQGPENRVEPLSRAAAVQILMRNILFFAHGDSREQRVLDIVCDLSGSVPVRRLTFQPDSAVWALVRQAR